MQNIILLHGALGAQSQFSDLIPLLNKDYAVHTLNFDGHGNQKPLKTFSIEHFSKNLVDYIRENELKQPLIFGYSMGGYVALYSAAQFPDLFGDIATLGTKFLWTPETAIKEAQMLQPEIIEEKVPKFAEYMKSLHGELNWKEVMNNTADMMLRLGQDPLLNDLMLAQVDSNVILNLGELDNMVSPDETLSVQHKLRKASFRKISELPHPIQKIKPELLNEIIRDSVHPHNT